MLLISFNTLTQNMTYHGRKRIMISPSPVAPHAPTSLSAYAEDPAIGPSPTLVFSKRLVLANYWTLIHAENQTERQ